MWTCHFYGLSLSTICRLRKMIDHVHLSSGLWTSDHLLLSQYIKYKEYNLSWGCQDLEKTTHASMTPSPTSLLSKEQKKKKRLSRVLVKANARLTPWESSNELDQNNKLLYVLSGLLALEFLQIAFPSISYFFNSF